MAGKRHHIIPRFLQKGFASRIDGEAIFTWLYRKGKVGPKEVSTKDTIVSEHFYGKGELSADDVITELERTSLSPLVDSLRDGRCDLLVESQNISELIAHLSIRSKLIRKGFEEMSTQFLGEMKGIFGDEATIDGLLKSAPESFIRNQFDAILTDPKAQGLQESMAILDHLGLSKEDVSSLITELVKDEFHNPETGNEYVKRVTDVFQSVFDPPSGTIQQSIKEGHIKSLISNAVPAYWVEVYKNFKWSVIQPNFSLILGDSPCVFREKDCIELVPACEPKTVSAVYLPISTTQVLAGSLHPDDLETIPSNFNESIAASSYEQFIASNSSDELTDLTAKIGSNANIRYEEQLETEVEQIRQNLSEWIFNEKVENRSADTNATVEKDRSQSSTDVLER